MHNYLFNSTLMVEPTNICNLKCKMCEARCSVEKNIVPRYLSEENLDLILSKLNPYVTNIVFQGDCEPTLHPKLEKLISISRKYVPHVSLVTNGTLLNEGRIRTLINSGLTWFAFSIDSHIKKEYESIRAKSDFNKVINNLGYIIRLRENEFPELRTVVHKIVFDEDTIEHLKSFIEFFYLEMGVDKLTFAPLVENGSVKYEDWISKRNQIEMDFLKKSISVNLKDFAHYPYKTLYRYCGSNCFFVSHDGTFSPCGVHTGTKNVFGNLIQEDLEQIVKKEIFQEFHNYWQNRRYDKPLPCICDDCFILKTPYFSYCFDENFSNCNKINKVLESNIIV